VVIEGNQAAGAHFWVEASGCTGKHKRVTSCCLEGSYRDGNRGRFMALIEVEAPLHAGDATTVPVTNKQLA
jgi:hypothetical protein